MDQQLVRVLGVDPGTRITGFGILDLEPGARPRLVARGAIRLPPGPIPERLRLLYRGLTEIIEEHRPGELAVETVFHGNSFESVLKVGEARGVVLLAGALNGLEIHQYTPARVKRTVTGNGCATKAQVQAMVVRLLDLAEAPEPRDVSDALALAICHGQRLWRLRLAASGRQNGKTESRKAGGALSALKNTHRMIEVFRPAPRESVKNDETR
jgi:crossover junction endodeoxyribonuclease RuvC